MGDAREVSQCVDCLFALPGELLEDGPASGIGECAKDVIGIGRLHGKTIANRLWFVKETGAEIFSNLCLAWEINLLIAQQEQRRGRNHFQAISP